MRPRLEWGSLGRNWRRSTEGTTKRSGAERVGRGIEVMVMKYCMLCAVSFLTFRSFVR